MSENTILNQLTLFAEDSLANLTVWPGSAEAQRMTVTSGLNFYALLRNSDPLGFLRKTFLASYHCISTRCWLTWKVRDTPAGRSIFQLAPSTLRTSESESLLWPTPTAGHGATGKLRKGENVVKSGGHKSRLEDAVVMWPTPRADSAMAATITEDADPNRYPNLETVLKKRNPSVVGGHLNPTWVEWLMGFPIGWTDLEPSETP